MSSRVVRPLPLPGGRQVKLVGYADDTSVCVTSMESLIEISRIISDFELATGSKLNRNNKTKIFGIGNWRNYQQWPINWLKTETDYMYTLGIYHGNEYISTLEKNWSTIHEKIQAHIQILFRRRLSLHQRVAYANSCILSKVWYISHIYPLNGYYATQINRSIFRYIWGGQYEPIRRTTICKPKREGGLGLINPQVKSKTLITNSFLKCYSDLDYENALMIHYCFLKMNNTIYRNFPFNDAAILNTPYYKSIIQVVDSLYQHPRFPIISNKKIYEQLLPKNNSLVDEMYPLFSWKKIWNNICDLKIYPFDKEIVYKHAHSVLATNSRLLRLNIIDSGNCTKCNNDKEQTAFHIFVECSYIAPFYEWLLGLMLYICNFKPNSNIRFIYFDNFYQNTYQQKLVNISVAMYICTVWRHRKENIRIAILKKQLIKAIIECIDFKVTVTKKSGEYLFGPYNSKLTAEVLHRF